MPAPRKLKLPIPTHIITGKLGSGKTSLLSQILQSKPPGIVWAVLLNEQGEASIDPALLEANTFLTNKPTEEVAVKELGGGCLCCALPAVTNAAIVQLVQKTKPDRLFIEPSGLASLSDLLQLLQGEHLRNALAIQPIISLLDITDRTQGQEEEKLKAQLELADIIIGTKHDIAEEASIAQFITWAERHKSANAQLLLRATNKTTLQDIGIE